MNAAESTFGAFRADSSPTFDPIPVWQEIVFTIIQFWT